MVFVVGEYTLYDFKPFTFIKTCFMTYRMVYRSVCIL